jgi:amidase
MLQNLYAFFLIVASLLKLTASQKVHFQSNSEDLSIGKIQFLIKKGVKCNQIIQHFSSRAKVLNPILNAVINFNHLLEQQARELDESFMKNRNTVGLLHCVPILIKDNINVAHLPTTGGIRAFDITPNKDASVVAKLKAQGALVLGKANLAELALGDDVSETGGRCKNPYDLRRTCGRSSSGIGSGISVQMSVIGIGTDTDGSILNPACFNGLYGLRTRMNEPEIDGIIPLNLLQDTVGPLARSIDDLVLSYGVIIGNLSLFKEFDQIPIDPNKLRLGLFWNALNSFRISLKSGNFNYKIDKEVHKMVKSSIKKLHNLGIRVVNFQMSHKRFVQFFKMYLSLLQIEQNFTLSAFKKQLNDFLISNSTFYQSSSLSKIDFNALRTSSLLSPFWKKFFHIFEQESANYNRYLVEYLKSKSKFSKIVDKWFEMNHLDAILVPSHTQKPFFHSEKLDSKTNFYSFMSISSLSNKPSLNIPSGFTKDGLPVGLLLICRSDTLLNTFRIARLFERSTY